MRQASHVGEACLAARRGSEMSVNAPEIESHRREDMLHMGLLQAEVAGASQTVGPNPVRNRPFDPRTACVLRLERLALLLLSSLLSGLVTGLRP